jgi:aminoglycoside 6'-N-acetyltransferase
MIITFKLLLTEHLPLLLKWLETPHVKAWWDQDVIWTPELIEEKFGSYIEGYKLEDGIRKEMRAYIIEIENAPIGYIQVYNVHDFPREDDIDISDLPKATAAFDWYIGKLGYVGKGYGAKVLEAFLNQIIFPKYECVFVDSETKNKAAIRTYEKAGFKTIKTTKDTTWMIKRQDA